MPLGLSALPRRVVAAPLAGVSTPRLAAAVTRAGGLGVLAGGDLRPEDLRAEVAAVRRETDGPFGVHLVLAEPSRYDLRDLDRYAGMLRPRRAPRRGVGRPGGRRRPAR